VAARDLGGKNEPVLTMVNNLPVFWHDPSLS
jgi:hypothetical protein